mgnify:CR=1 FL=1
MTAARDDDFMALPGMEADSNTHDTARHRSDDTAPASSKSALDALLDEYRARAKSEREKGTLFEELTRQFLLNDARFAHQFKEIYLWGEWPERRTGDTGIDLVAIPVSHITLADLHTHDERLNAKMNSMKLNGQEAQNIIIAQVNMSDTTTRIEQTTGLQLGKHKHALYGFTRNYENIYISEEQRRNEDNLHKITTLREVISSDMKGETN